MVFKECPKCGCPWPTRDHFLRDPALKLIGYQANFKALKAGILLFNHNCRTTLALQALDFADMYDGPMFVERAAGSDACPGHCLHESELAPCPTRCECAFIRNILQLIQSWPKQNEDESLKMKVLNALTRNMNNPDTFHPETGRSLFIGRKSTIIK